MPVESRPLSRLLTLAWPIVVQRATQSVIGLADALMVAPLGEAALAAVTTGALDTFIIIILPMGTVFIVQSFAAQLRGRGDWVRVRRFAWYGLMLAALAGVLGLAALPWVPAFVQSLGYDPEVTALMTSYLGWRLLSVTPVVATEALVNWYGGLGNTRIAMISGVSAMLANVALNYVLIEPRWGLPGYGVEGAAVASLIASVVGLLPVAWLFLRGRGIPGRGPLGLRTSEFWRMLRFGLPNGVNWFLEFGAFILFINLIVGHLGTTTLAAFNVVLQLNSVAFMPAFGVASAGAILVGEAIGSGRKDDVRGLVTLTAKVTSLWMVSVGLAYLLAPRALLGFFAGENATTQDFIETGRTILLFACLWQLFDAWVMTFGEALRAAGDTAWSMWARIALGWGLFVPSAWLLVIVLDGAVPSLMLSIVVYVTLLALVLLGRFVSGRWRRIELVGEPELDDLLPESAAR